MWRVLIKMCMSDSRPDYHTMAEIESELQWITDLKKHNVIKPPHL